MKTTILILSIFVLLFASCGTRRNVEQASVTYDEGVVINGVRWATRNVGRHGRFTANPHDAGVLFTFYQAQRACPSGWRLPTYEELLSLVDAESEWTVVNRVQGRLVGTAPNQLFFPATGFRTTEGRLGGVGSWGFYWSSTPATIGNWIYDLSSTQDIRAPTAWRLYITSDNTGVDNNIRSFGFSVRCVADVDLSE